MERMTEKRPGQRRRGRTRTRTGPGTGMGPISPKYSPNGSPSSALTLSDEWNHVIVAASSCSSRRNLLVAGLSTGVFG